MLHVTTRVLLLFFVLALSGCSADAPTRSNTFLELTAISITSEYSSVANLTDNQFTATGDYSGEINKDISTEVIWSSSDTNILDIDGTGLATAVSAGTVIVTAISGEISSQIEFTVSNASILSLTVTPAVQSAPAGVERDYSVSGTFDDDSVQNLDRIVMWTSLDPDVAIVTSTGVAIGKEVGTASIQAEWQGKSDVATLNVTAAELTDLTITPSDAEYPVGLIIQYSLTGTYSDGSTEDLTNQAFWESDDTTNAIVNNAAGEEGKIEMVGSGYTNIVATYTDSLIGEQEATTGLDVNNSTLSEIHIYATVYAADGEVVSLDENIESGDTLDIFDDETVHFSAVGEYSDSAEHDITTLVTWSSNDTGIATISNSKGFEGFVTPGNDTGNVAINAAFDALEITFTLDVTAR